jgi:hypothetical protein
MGKEVFIDLEVLADLGDEYLVRIGKNELNSLVTCDTDLVVRHWDGNSPVVLEPYGETAVRTRDDAKSTNNLASLPDIDVDELLLWLMSEE